jgi:hypothetical protein
MFRICRPRESGGPGSRRHSPSWAPACAGMTVSTLVTPANAGVREPPPLAVLDARLRGHDSIAAACQILSMTERRYSVYIMASRRNGTLYVGVTNHLAARAFQHRSGHGSEFTSKYGVTRLVWYEH